MEKKQIVIYNGSFNPPLNSHFSLAEQLTNEYSEIEKIIFVPANNKYEKEGLMDEEHRYKMLKLVCDKNEKFEVSRIEIDDKENTRAPYTSETLKRFQKLYPEYEIATIMGSDNLKEIEIWDAVDDLVKYFKIYITKRGEDDIDKIIESSEFLKTYQNSFIKAPNKIVSNLSSTYVRNNLKQGKSIKYLAPDEVIDYIKENNLYTS